MHPSHASSWPSKGCGRRPGGAILVALLVGWSSGVFADALQEAQELKRQMQYDRAEERLGIALPDLAGERRAQALLALAGLTTDHKTARRLLLEAGRETRVPATRLAADLELARLDFARGNYRSVETRLQKHDGDRDVALLRAQSLLALEETNELRRVLRPAKETEHATLLLGWADRERGDIRRALATFEYLSRREPVTLPTVLLWKTQAEAALGLRDRALATCGELQDRFPQSPEATMVLPTLSSLQRGRVATPAPSEPPPRTGRLFLQVGAFEDRGNALRYQETLQQHVQAVRVEEIHDGPRRLYRVQVGPFETRTQAETFGRTQLAPRGYSFSIVRPEESEDP